MKGWRTIAVFALSGVVYLLAWDQLANVISPKYIAVATTVVGIAMRFITSTPIGTPPPAA